jgi:predicted ester cyclase
VAEGEFVGRHIGEFAGIPATGREVRVPICVAYDVKGDKITRARIYLLASVLMQQLGAMPELAHAG